MRIPALFFSFCLSLVLSAQNTLVFRSKAYEHASVSVCVLDLAANRTVVQINQERGVTPASVLKLLTTGAALDLLGPDYRFETKVLVSGTIQSGILSGDLRVLGGGDPTLGSRQVKDNPEAFLTDWVKAIKAAGINRIQGRILADPSAFDDEGVSPYWLWEDIGNYYATGIYGLNAFDNSFKLELQSGATGTKPTILGTVPTIPGLTVDNRLLAADNDLDSAYLYGAPFQNDMRLFGTVPANRNRFAIRGQLPDPAAYLAFRLKEAFIQAGITVDGEALSTREMPIKPETPERVLCTTKSVPLAQIVRIIHEKSDNFYTECLLRQLARIASDRPATAREGLRAVRRYWEGKGVNLSGLYLYDACGLSPNDRISAALLAQILRCLSSNSTFVQSLPLAGVEGTVSGFLNGTTLEGKLRLKSGSNQVVNSYAGYYNHNGKHFAVVLMVNHADASRYQIRKDMETFLLSL